VYTLCLSTLTTETQRARRLSFFYKSYPPPRVVELFINDLYFYMDSVYINNNSKPPPTLNNTAIIHVLIVKTKLNKNNILFTINYL
jgi:hypothetical protein